MADLEERLYRCEQQLQAQELLITYLTDRHGKLLEELVKLRKTNEQLIDTASALLLQTRNPDSPMQ